MCTQTIYKRVIVTFGTTVPVISFCLDACNLSHLVSLCAFLLTNPVGGYLSLWCHNLCYDKFSFRGVYVGTGGVCVESLVDYLVPWVDRLIMTVLQNLVHLTLCQWDHERTWAILCCNLALGGPSGLRFLLYKTMGEWVPLLKFQDLGSI